MDYSEIADELLRILRVSGYPLSGIRHGILKRQNSIHVVSWKHNSRDSPAVHLLNVYDFIEKTAPAWYSGVVGVSRGTSTTIYFFFDPHLRRRREVGGILVHGLISQFCVCKIVTRDGIAIPRFDPATFRVAEARDSVIKTNVLLTPQLNHSIEVHTNYVRSG